MKGKKILWLVGVLVLVGAAALYYFSSKAKGLEDQYQTAVIKTGDLTAVVGATGTVRARQSAQLTWQTSGTVESVNVKPGSLVSPGDILASLSKTSVAQNIIMAETDLMSAQRALEDLNTSTLARTQAEQAVVEMQKAYDKAKARYDGIDYQRASDSYIKNAQAELDLAQQQLSLARRAYKLVEKLNDGDARKAQGLKNLTSAEMRVDQLKANLTYVTGRPDDLEISERKAALDVATAQLEDAKRKLERVKDGPDSLDVATLQARVAAAEATLNQMYIKAPFGGVITASELLVGDQVSPGMTSFRLDDLSHLQVDVQVSEIDINSVQAGQPVTMSFDAIVGKTYRGAVIEVGQTGVTMQGAVNFTVTVELQDADESVKPGMTAAVNILVKEVKNVLVVPNQAVRISNGQRVVYLLKDGAPEMVSIQLGATSDTTSEVLNGDLKVGDTIILNPPAALNIRIGHPGGD